MRLAMSVLSFVITFSAIAAEGTPPARGETVVLETPAQVWWGGSLEAQGENRLYGVRLDLRLPLSDRRPLYFDWSLEPRGLSMVSRTAGERALAVAVDMGFGLSYGRRLQGYARGGFDLVESTVDRWITTPDDGVDIDTFFQVGVGWAFLAHWRLDLYSRYNHITGIDVRDSFAFYPGIAVLWRR